MSKARRFGFVPGISLPSYLSRIEERATGLLSRDLPSASGDNSSYYYACPQTIRSNLSIKD